MLSLSTAVFADNTTTFSVDERDVSNGYVVKKIWLQNFEIPAVKLDWISYTTQVTLPQNAIPSDPAGFDIVLGKERKKPFALVRIPVYSLDKATSQLKRITGFTLSYSEKPVNAALKPAAKGTAAPSPLAAGNWYKIAVTESGLYKIDYDFVTSKLGVNAASFSTANIRVFGNGGHMLPENNALPYNENLTENAIWVNDGGDGVFNPGDYIVFYAQGPTAWTADASINGFRHEKNLYDDKSYYFLNFDQGAGKRITGQGSVGSANVFVTSFNDYAVHEEDLFNPGAFGKTWWGEDFGADPGKVSTRDFTLNLQGNSIGDADFRIKLASRSASAPNVFTLSLNGVQQGSYTLSTAGTDDQGAQVSIEDAYWHIPYNSNAATIKLDYQAAVSSGIGYLGYIEINTRCGLAFSGPRLNFRDLNSVGAGNIAGYQLGNATGATQVWDVTDPLNPVRMNGSLSGNIYQFTQSASSLHEFAALNNDQLPAPEYTGTVANQDIHGSGQVDYIIVTHPDFLSQAERLAEFHRQRSNMRVLVATTPQVYNEFSSGRQDISAIRNMARMFYDRAGNDSTEMPKYLLLFGDASYDYKNRVPNNTNYVPTFESAESTFLINSFCNDDFFAFLDDNENVENTSIANTLDLGVGRLPVKNLDEARAVVDKIFVYKSPDALGPWRISTTIVTDNEDEAGPHMEDGEVMDSTIVRNSNIYNATKIYEDAIPMVSSPGGTRAPDANKSINDQMIRGTFLINYNGHGNTDVLSHERIVTQDDYTKWKNIKAMPFMVTATCDFGRFDHPEYVSAGERVVLKGDGGVITALTTTQLVYQSANRIINKDFLNAQFQHINGRWNTFGDAFRIGKNLTYGKSGTSSSDIINFRKFALLGDPALEPDFPEFFISTDSLIEGATGKPVTTMSALGEYIIKGSVTDINKNLLSNFNGTLSVTIFDKPRTVKTITSINKTFQVQNNIIYKGKATVNNGHFAFSFITPKDINYNMGGGKISYYAENGMTDAAGADTSKSVGGYSDYPVIENNPPKVRPFIEDSLFVNGGLTNPNTTLFVILEDETGINVSGNSVGHDLTAVLDGDIKNPYIMNDYYETAPNTYKRGYVNFPITNLPLGRHSLTVKAWDVNNNSAEGTVDFEVVEGGVVKVQHLINYPNPFTDVTHFMFEHNHPDEPMAVEINVYNTSGQNVRNLKQNFTPTGSRSNEISWDGTDNQGARLPSGVYVYRVKISTDKGISTLAYQKLVIVR